jgi:hypothetical protein
MAENSANLVTLLYIVPIETWRDQLQRYQLKKSNLPWRSGQVVSSSSTSEATGILGHEIESRQIY